MSALTLLAAALTKSSSVYSEDAAADVLEILQNTHFVLEQLNADILSSKEEKKINVCIANAGTRPPSQSTKWSKN